MPNHQRWRLEYRENRYARHLSQPELNRRIRDIVVNSMVLTADRKVRLIPTDETWDWAELFTHVLEEMVLRHGPYPAGFTRDILHLEPFPDFAGELARRAAATAASFGSRRGDTLIKFGQRKYMEALYERGAFRIQPASYFAAASHNGAVRDDELGLGLSLVLSRAEFIKVVTNPQDVQVDAPDQRIDVQVRAQSDYWLYCVSRSSEPRLFVDFDADSCVVIQDPNSFRTRLSSAAGATIADGAEADGPAKYLDPLRPKTARIQVPFAKHFRYSYQQEYRFVWMPRAPTSTLAHVDVEIGSIRDIAKFVTL